ncbi:5'-adenylylsulfate reductase-like 4 isoform X2 [Abrus precatorius]|uniref:5'-adenylylsulfate reductase-like 4 isoform X2 n=1 Tax=Abrus precatorius TaxID=3816 RepID=A0A8B8MC87_ABRPR|nr:5'-adenylylsulfate reductase-like 4 isoform X2 [Abrus precatorius]
MRVSGSVIIFAVLLCGTLSSTAQSHSLSPSSAVCPVDTPLDFILGFPDWTQPLPDSVGSIAVTEGDEVSLQKALHMVHKNDHDILSKYGVHGFPTLFILNSTMRVRYHGSRKLDSLIVFYSDVTGIRIASSNQLSLVKIGHPSATENHGNTEPESCPFSWARSPENLLRQETYLALATTFVVLRLLYLFFPTLRICIQYVWRRIIQNVRIGSLLEHPLVYLKRIIQSFNYLKEPCKRSNLQEGAMNAKAWASKSLATVSIGEESSGRGMHQ